MYYAILANVDTNEFYQLNEFNDTVREALNQHTWAQNLVAVVENPTYWLETTEWDDMQELIDSIEYKINHTELTSEQKEKYTRHMEALKKASVTT